MVAFNYSNTKYLFLAGLFILVNSLYAQEQMMQVVTKSIEKSMPFGLGTEISIEGEKADVFLSSWDRNQIAVYLDLVAKHPDKKVAEQDLERMDYDLELRGQKIIVKNYIDQKEGAEKPASSLKARYTIILPSNCPVNLSNFFGTADVRDLTNALVINSEFCKLDLTNLSGDINISTRFGDINGREISGNVLILSNRSNISLADIQGVFKIKSRYGKINIDAQPQSLDLEIDAMKSDVYFANAPVGYFSFLLSTESGKITVPQEMPFKYTEQISGGQQASFNPGTQISNVKIQTTFGNIVIGPTAMN